MANGCVNGTLDEANYSAPVPVIGLYIAAGSFVCMLLMFFDIISAFRQRQRWMPCRVFSLNSLTLSLLGISTKLPVDLTSAMPSAVDQFSKLTATTLLCVAMGFLSPSVGNNTGSDYTADMVALSILVITVAVNLCMQISTGVVYVFVVEHIIVMFCMLLLLLFLWSSIFKIKNWNHAVVALIKTLVPEATKNILRQLKLCYLCGVEMNPQMKTASTETNFAISGTCFISFGVLLQAAGRSLFLKQQLEVCRGTSDYDWSIWIIVAAQMLTVGVGCFAVSVRWFTLFSFVDFSFENLYSEGSADAFTRIYLDWLGAHFWRKCGTHLLYYVSHILTWVMIVVLMPAKLFKVFEHHACTASAVAKQKPAFAREFKKVVPESLREYIDDGWTARKAISDLNRWMDTSRSKTQTSLSQLLQRYDEPFCLLRFSRERISLYPQTVNGFFVYPMSVALLVEIATFLMPDNLTSSMVQSFHEVSELIIYTEARIMKPEQGPMLLQSLKLGKVVSGGDVFHTYLRPIMKRNKSFEEGHPSQSPLNDALLILQQLESTCYKNESDEDSLEDDGATCEDGLGDDLLFKHVGEISREINYRGPYETIEALRDFVEQMFCDFVRILLTHLPVALIKEVMESPPQELEERSKHALKMISKIESFEELIEWNLYRGDTILSLMHADSNNSEDEEEEDV